MSIDMKSQVRAYADFLDSTLPVLEAEDSMVELIGDPPVQPVQQRPIQQRPIRPLELRPKPLKSAPRRRSLRVGLAAVMVGLLITGVAGLTRGTPDGEVIDQPSVTSIPSPPDPTLTDPTLSSDRSGVFGDGVEVRPHLASVVAAGPGFVAAGGSLTGCCTVVYEDAAVWTSADGFTWSRSPHDQAVFGQMRQQGIENVTAGGPGLVAVGWLQQSGDFEDPGLAAVVWTSVDGVRWSLVPHDEEVFGGPGNQGMSSVTVGGPGLVAVGHDGGGYGRSVDAAVWTSVDGFTWTRVPHDEVVFGGAEMHSVVAGGPGLVAVGSNGLGGEADEDFATDALVWTSVDGVTWSRMPPDEAVFGGQGDQSMNMVVAAGPGFVAVGVGGGGNDNSVDAAVWTSGDGIAWSRVPHDEAIFGGAGRQEMSDVTVGGPGLVAVGFDGRCLPDLCQDVDAAVWASVDGVTWARVAISEEVFAVAGSQSMSSVASTNGTLVAVGHDRPPDTPRDGDYELAFQAAVWTSTDGITWSRVTHDTATADEAG